MQSTDYEVRLAEAVEHVSEFSAFGANRPAPTILLLSGSGLSDLASDPVATLGYQSIPGFPRASVAGHGNELVLQEVADKLVLAMNGSFHL